MNKYFVLAISLCCLACKPNDKRVLTLDSPTDAPLKSVPIVMSRADCEALLGPIGAQKGVIFAKGELRLDSQFDDLDQDGIWDEVSFSSNLPEQLNISKGPLPAIKESRIRTNLHFAKVIKMGEEYEETSFGERIQGTDTKVTQTHFQYEGPGWENDRIAFRNYFDERNGFDIFGKITTDMILSQVGTGQNYHSLLPWGMDILKVGNSLGSGAIALWYEDSLYRVSVPQGATYKALTEGPIRSVFELRFPAMPIGEHSLEVIQTISIYAGINGFSSSVAVSPYVEGLLLAPGIVNLASDSLYHVSQAQTEVIYTYDQQAFLEENLGMGLVSQKPDFVRSMMAPEEGAGITQTFLSLLQLYADRPTKYQFIAGWELTDPAFKTQEGFLAILLADAHRWSFRQGSN